jgi:1-acyl-sn-glycerol-3-phosphate acyltransferase
MKPRNLRGDILARPNVHRFLRLTVGTWLRLRYNMATENAPLLRRVRRPYLLLPNHVGYWDPFQLSSFVPYPVHHVAADQNFRTRLLRFVMWAVGAIPKTKGVSDSELIRTILRLRDRREIICLFPEGQRTWDGAGLPVLYSTAKLVKLLKIPVIVPVFKGGYLSHPRWAFKPRRGRLVIEFRFGFEAAELKDLSVDEIYQRLSSLIDHDDYQWQAAHMVRFRGPRPAEDLEHVLFRCPRCGRLASMHSRGRRFGCEACGHAMTYTDYGYLIPDDDRSARLTVRDLHREQLAAFRADLDGVPPGTAIFREPDTVLSVGYRTNPVRRIGPGTLTLYADRIEWHPAGGGRAQAGSGAEAGGRAEAGSGGADAGARPNAGGGGAPRAAARGAAAALPAPPARVIRLSGIEGLNVQLIRKLELYFEDRLYTFDPTDRARSMYKWQIAIEHLTAQRVTDAGLPA